MPTTRPTRQSLYATLSRIEMGLAQPGGRGYYDRERIQGTYPFIPFDVGDFVKLVSVAPRHVMTGRGKSAPKRFLDVGAGYGTKVILAKTVLDQVTSYAWCSHGIEIEKRYVDASLTHEVTLADGLTYGQYADYDIIYLYCPFSDPALQVKLQQAIIDGARPGAVVLFAGCCKVMAPTGSVILSAGHPDRRTIPNPFTDQMEHVKVDLGDAAVCFNGSLGRMVWRKKGYASQAGAPKVKALMSA